MLYIFDWDGTLCDSAAKIIACMHRASEAQGLTPCSDDEVRDIIGLSLPEALARLYPELDERGIGHMCEAYGLHFREADQIPCELFPGVSQTLDELVSRGHQIAVATGKSRAGLNRVWSNMGLEGVFHSSRCADETASKPHPRMLFELLHELKVAATDAVMVGDTEFDMEMARRADVPRVAVDYGAHHVSRLKAYDPLMCVSEMSSILSLA
jgi:phosphoglycolate phosphatase